MRELLFAPHGRLNGLCSLIESPSGEDEQASGVFAWRISPLRRPGGRSPTGITARAARVHSANISTHPPAHPPTLKWQHFMWLNCRLLSAAADFDKIRRSQMEKIFPSAEATTRAMKIATGIKWRRKGTERALALSRAEPGAKIELKSRGGKVSAAEM